MLGNFLNRRLKKHTCQVALALGQACGWCHLAPQCCCWSWCPGSDVQGGLGVGGDPCSFTFPLPWPFCSLRKERGPLDLSVPYLALGLALACLFPFLWNQEWNEHWLGNLDSKTARAISSPLVFLLRKQKKTKQYLLNLVYDCPKYGRPCPLSETSAPLLSNPPQNLPILGITAFI